VLQWATATYWSGVPRSVSIFDNRSRVNFLKSALPPNSGETITLQRRSSPARCQLSKSLSNLLADGTLMRHSRFMTTTEIYEQDLPESQLRAVEKLSALVN
jgi:hypothetical protein